jgi:uncharacterized protein DUF3237
MESSELLYEVALRITGVVEYGVSLEALTTGKSAPPPEGARFDISVEGTVDGPKLKGSWHGVDYLNIRADGLPELHIHGQFDLADGGKVSMFADGVAPVDANGIAHLRENVTLKSNFPAHAWVNTIVVWGVGTVNLATGEVRVKGYKA